MSINKRGRPAGIPQNKGNTAAYHNWLIIRMGISGKTSIAALARETGIHYKGLCRIVSGDSMPSLWSHILLSKALGADLGEGLEVLYGKQ